MLPLNNWLNIRNCAEEGRDRIQQDFHKHRTPTATAVHWRAAAGHTSLHGDMPCFSEACQPKWDTYVLSVLISMLDTAFQKNVKWS